VYINHRVVYTFDHELWHGAANGFKNAAAELFAPNISCVKLKLLSANQQVSG